MATVSSVPDAPRIHPLTQRSMEVEDEAPSGDVAPWEAPPAPVPEDATPVPLLRGTPTPPLDLPLPVLVLTEQARRVPEAERPLVAARLNLQLSRMARTGGDRLVADTFLRLLESGRLSGLVDAKGRTCRAAAVEALLSLGFPYALEVQPEDLAHLRANTLQRKTHRLKPGACVAVLVGGIGAQVVHEALFRQGDASLLTSQVGLSLLAMAALWLAPPRTPVYRVGLLMLTLVSLAGAVSTVLGVADMGLWVGLAGLVAAFLAALREG
ncbi:hypothetical protein HNV28_11025 [Myxococcus xanthus]|uniref:Uncharacterized protein n=1 Tax=Myxococcus xanthus TaxID=34 RepID=A0A7Y4MRV4_MYXXA|nr:hypothetical protein [Myxococcus xanthus]NOJ85695.1 hypothetical protein [Myxococcus xanthus]